uniref:Uncharacterized protein n=1 Tax=Aegilops tauschii subsp. strangulata TaxID=200361 RepID=A0A453G3C4_AEGTS
MPLDGDGGAKLPQEENGVTPLGGTAARSRHEDRRQARRRCCLGWCDAISKIWVVATAWGSALRRRRPRHEVAAACARMMW